MKINFNLIIIIILILILIVFVLYKKSNLSFLITQESIFPFRLLCNEKRELLPIVALTAFLRTEKDRTRYNDYISKGINVIGYTSYKTFPKPIKDGTADEYNKIDNFDYTKEIKNWVCCFKIPEDYTFTSFNNLLEMSESDFKDIDDTPPLEKEYDFIYSCLNDDPHSCPLNGWNAVNRNFDLALKCFPIMVNEYNFKILIVGRTNCGLEKLYPKNIEIVDMLPYDKFQEKLKKSRFLFVPNIYDASPRVVTEAITKNVPVLMNKDIVCGSKYINYETGELFTNENDIRSSIDNLINKKDSISPQKWWSNNYSKSKSGIKFRNFLYNFYPKVLKDSKEIHFN